MKELFRPKEVNSSSNNHEVKRRETIFRPKQTKETVKPRKPSTDSIVSKKEKQSKLRKLITAAMTTTSTAAIVAVAILTSSLNSVSLYAKTATSLTFLVDFSERGEIVYELTNSQDYFDSIVDDINSNYVSFEGLEPSSEYTFSVIDVSSDRNVLFSKSYYTSSDEVSVDGEYYLSSDGLYGMLWINDGTETDMLDTFWSVIIQDVNTKVVYSIDTFTREIQIELPYLTSEKYIIYAKYGGDMIYAKTITNEEAHIEPFAYLYGEYIDSSVDVYYQYYGYGNVRLEIRCDGILQHSEDLGQGEGNVHLDRCVGDCIAYLYSDNNIIYELAIEHQNSDISNVSFGLQSVTFQLPQLLLSYSIEYSGFNLSYSIIIESFSGDVLACADNLTQPDGNLVFNDISSTSAFIKVLCDEKIIFSQEIHALPFINAEYINDELSINYEVFDNEYYTIYVYDINDEVVYYSPLSMSGYLNLPSLTDSYYHIVLITNDIEVYSTEVRKGEEFNVEIDYTFVDGTLEVNCTPSQDSVSYAIKITFDDDLIFDNDYTCGYTSFQITDLVEGNYKLMVYSNGSLIFACDLIMAVTNNIVSLPDYIFIGENGYNLPMVVEGIEVTYSLNDDTSLAIINQTLYLVDIDTDVSTFLLVDGDDFHKVIAVLSYPRVLRETVDDSSYTVSLSNVLYNDKLIAYLDGEKIIPIESVSSDTYTLTLEELNSNTEYHLELLFEDTCVYSSIFTTDEIIDDEFNIMLISYDVTSSSYSAQFMMTNLENKNIKFLFDGEEINYYEDPSAVDYYRIDVDGLSPETYYYITVVSILDNEIQKIYYQEEIITDSE